MGASLPAFSVMASAMRASAVIAMPSLDAQDMKALCLGDHDAFRRIVRRHQTRILAYSLRFVGDSHHAQDLSQEVFLTLWRERKSYREDGKLEFFLLKIARLRCLAHLKKSKAQERLTERASQVRSAAAAFSDMQGEDVALQAALQGLSADHRDLIVLRHFEGLELTEIKTMTGLRMGTIKSRLHRGLAALRKELQDGHQ